MWNCKECCKCFRQSPKNDTWGYACDEARNQGFLDIAIQFWMECDPERPKNWQPFTPGPISIFSTLCTSCQTISVKEYFDLLKGYALRHDYRYHGGAGAHNSYSYKPMPGCFIESIYYCAVCLREVVTTKGEAYDKKFKQGFILVGASGYNGSILFCPECTKKTKVNQLVSLTESAKKENKKWWREAFPNSDCYKD